MAECYQMHGPVERILIAGHSNGSVSEVAQRRDARHDGHHDGMMLSPARAAIQGPSARFSDGVTHSDEPDDRAEKSGRIHPCTRQYNASVS